MIHKVPLIFKKTLFFTKFSMIRLEEKNSKSSYHDLFMKLDSVAHRRNKAHKSLFFRCLFRTENFIFKLLKKIKI